MLIIKTKKEGLKGKLNCDVRERLRIKQKESCPVFVFLKERKEMEKTGVCGQVGNK